MIARLIFFMEKKPSNVLLNALIAVGLLFAIYVVGAYLSTAGNKTELNEPIESLNGDSAS